MKKELLYIVSDGSKNQYLKNLIEIFLNQEGYQLEGHHEIPYYEGILRINLSNKTFKSIIDFPDRVDYPTLAIIKKNDYNRVITYLKAESKLERKKILEGLNEKIIIEFSNFLDGSPVFQFAILAYSYFTNPESDTLTISGDNKLFYAIDKEREVPVGIIIFKIEQNGCYYKIKILKSFVEQEYRNQGIWSKLWMALVSYAKLNNIEKIEGRIYKNNQPMIEAAQQVGREISSHNTIYYVKK